jgi:hypothetical protein
MEIGRVDKEGQGMKSLSNRVLVELIAIFFQQGGTYDWQ